MNIIDLTKKVKFKDVARALRFHYPYPKINKVTMDRYEVIMNSISWYKNKEVKNEQLVISLVKSLKVYSKEKKEWFWLVEEGDEYYSTKMEKKGDKMTYAIEFTRWEESSNWKIATKTLNAYKPAEIMAHYLWEITFCGFTQAPIQKKANKLNEMVDEIKSGKAKLVKV